MKPLVKSLSLISLLLFFLACEVLAPILTKNYFEGFKDYNPLGDVIPESDWSAVTDQEAKIQEYTDIVFGDERHAEDLYEQLKNEPNYKRAMANTFMDNLVATDVPLFNSVDFSEESLDSYQKSAMALARLEVYGSNEFAITGYNQIILDYASSNQDESLTTAILMDYLFDSTDDSEISSDILSLYNAGRAIDLLGATIINGDDPSSKYISDDDAILIIVSAMIYTIVEDSVASFADRDAVITALVEGIISETSTFDSNLVFPQDDTGTDEPIVKYLGENGALVYAASGFELPVVEEIFGGAE